MEAATDEAWQKVVYDSLRKNGVNIFTYVPDAGHRMAIDLSLADLLARPQRELTLDFQCVTGWRVQDVRWKGVRVADLLDEAGVAAGATHLRIWSFDGAYTESLTLDQARAAIEAQKVATEVLHVAWILGVESVAGIASDEDAFAQHDG